MITPINGIQRAMMQQNAARMSLVSSADKAFEQLEFCAVKPQNILKADVAELNTKANETKLAVAQKMADAYEKGLAKKIKNSVPKYAGLDCKA